MTLAEVLFRFFVGGAIVPYLFGSVADISGNIRLALAVPLICYAIIASFGLWATRRTAA